MTSSRAKTGEKSFQKAFGQGLLAVLALYVGIFTYVGLQADKTLEKLEGRFPFRVVLIERAPEAYVYPPAPSAQVAMPEAEQQAAPVVEQQTQVAVPMGPLEPAPFAGLYQQVKGGKLPIISEAGLTPFEAYKRPFAYLGSPVISLAIRDYGLSAADSDQALAMPPEVSLILSPYAPDPELWQKKAREAGHEVWLSLPLENTRFLIDDPGPEALLTHSSVPENKKRLEQLLSSVTGYAGVVGETDKAFLDMHAMLGDLINIVFKSGLGYVEMNPAGNEFLETLAVAENAPFTDVDENATLYTDKDFTRLESTARQKGYVTATVALLPKNLEAMHLWALSLNSKGVVLAPLSAVAAGRVPKKSQPRPTGAPETDKPQSPP